MARAVMMHGIPTSSRLWRHGVPLVSGGRCLARNMVGYSTSIPEGQGRDSSVARQADYLLEWMESQTIGPAVLVSHDLGGSVA